MSETIKYHEEAGKIHGYSEEQIRAFAPEKEQMEKIRDYFDSCRFLWGEHGNTNERVIIAGYNVGFDIKHLTAAKVRLKV